MTTSEQFWNKSARKYAKKDIKDQKGYKKTLDQTKRHLGPDKSVLEVGCGTGTTALILAEHTKEYTATDISSEMIKIANERKAAQKVANVNFIRTTLEDPALKERTFDVVLAYNLIHLLEDTDKVVRRIYRILKPGGVFISKTPCMGEKSRFWPMLARVLGSALGIGTIKSFSIDEYQEVITKQGFEVIETHVQRPKPIRLFVVAKKKE